MAATAEDLRQIDTIAATLLERLPQDAVEEILAGMSAALRMEAIDSVLRHRGRLA